MTIRTLNYRLRHSGRALLLAAALATAPPAHANQSSPEAELAANNEAIVREAFGRWSQGGNVFAELLAPDIRWTIHGSGPVAGTYTSIESFVEDASVPLISRLATPLTPEVHDIWSVGDTVIIRFDGSATTTSGAPYVNQLVWIFRMAEGRVIEAEAFLDLVAYQQVIDDNEPRGE